MESRYNAMLMLSGKKKVNVDFYDKVYFATTTCPGIPVGCIHRPDLAAPKEWEQLCYNGQDEEFYRRYIEMWSYEPYKSRLQSIIDRASKGEYIQLIFYEDDPKDGERPHLYRIIKSMTDSDVRIE